MSVFAVGNVTWRMDEAGDADPVHTCLRRDSLREEAESNRAENEQPFNELTSRVFGFNKMYLFIVCSVAAPEVSVGTGAATMGDNGCFTRGWIKTPSTGRGRSRMGLAITGRFRVKRYRRHSFENSSSKDVPSVLRTISNCYR